MYNANNEEQKILDFWEKDKTFEKSVNSRPEDKPYVFYDGPPFATGLPHYGHIVASLMKDVVPRYQTMRGFRVERRWGWDCHGLPIENIVEKELGTKSKKDIEAMGVAKFNELCRSKVLGYVEEWKKTIRRLGRWVDMENAYSTMDFGYMESVWWVFKELWEKELIYQDYRSMHICPRCETTLSQQEVSEGYKDIKDISATVKFKLKETRNKKQTIGEEDVYILAWTTTPWTLPGNVLLAVNAGIKYQVVSIKGEEGHLIMAAELAAKVMGDKQYVVVKEIQGNDLVGLEYEPLFPYYKDTKNAFRVVAGDFVTTTDGTGIVHIAPAFGDDDFQVGKREKISLVQHVTMNGKFKDEVTDFAGMDVKPKEDTTKTDVEIIKWLAHNGKLFSKQKIEHSYPHCWRCDTPLLNYATSSWFVKVTAVKDKAIKIAKKINWSPEHIKEGRFGKWLEGARDWSISRQRFWASVMPVWRCESLKSCNETVVFGSVAELEKASGQKIEDLHKHIVDEITFPCEKCGGTMKRIPDVLDTWFDSGSMPYAQVHYPFENKKKFEESFPAEFIAEGQDQTRAWFYYLHVLATALSGKVAFENVIVNGIVLAEDGKKMSKKLQNYPDPNMVLEKYGADALRYYLVTSPVMHAESLNFSEASVREMFNKVVNTLYNVLEFYKMFADSTVIPTSKEESLSQSPNGQRSFAPLRMTKKKSEHVLDRWILAKLQVLVKEVTEELENYNLAEASRPIGEFITELSQWYVRRIRDRVKEGSEEEKQAALTTLREVLLTLSKLMAPFTPFVAEKVWQEVNAVANVGAKGLSPLHEADNGASVGAIHELPLHQVESVHLQEWPKYYKEHHDHTVLEQMTVARKIVEMGLALRAENKLKVRQPLSTLFMNKESLSHELLQIIADELNVKKVDFAEYQEPGNGWAEKVEGEVTVWLNTTIDEQLKKEGLLREVIRTINQMRKEQGLTIADRVLVEYSTSNKELKQVFSEFEEEIKKSVLASAMEERENEGTKVEIDGASIQLNILKK